MPIFNWLLIDSAIEVGDNKLPPAGEREVADILSVGVLFTECQICGCIIYTSLIFIYIAGFGDAIHNETMAIQAPPLDTVYLHRSVHIGSVWKDSLSVQTEALCIWNR